MTRQVAALYIDPRGPYPSIAGVDCWDEARDARGYGGPAPVVAHPPCGAWSNLRHLSHGGDKDCGPRAVEQVRMWGGVLEQPAGSKLWKHCGLPLPCLRLPGRGHDAFGYSIEVQQVSWGHVARKKTWLYLVGVPRAAMRAGLLTGGSPTHWVSGGRNPLRKNGRRGGGVVPPGIKVCSAQQRRRTPPAFAEWLVKLARASRKPSPRKSTSWKRHPLGFCARCISVGIVTDWAKESCLGMCAVCCCGCGRKLQ